MPNKNKLRFIQTVKESFQKKSNNTAATNPYNTTYNKRYRYLDSISHSKAESELRSHNISPSFDGHNTLNSFVSKKSRRKLTTGNNKDKLKAYQDIKESMLGTFYIGQKLNSKNREEP